MPDRRQHRSQASSDASDFGPRAVPALRRAVAHLAWMLSRGYAERSAVELVGNRFALTARQRVAVSRSACADGARSARRSREAGPPAVAGRPVFVDGFNLIVTLEAALAGGVLLLGRDGALRDMASVHGSYRRVEETVPAIGLAVDWLAPLQPAAVRWLLDRPVSNSGRLAALIRGAAAGRGLDWDVQIVDDPDPLLRRAEGLVVSADSAVLDRCGPWIPAARWIVAQGVARPWVLDLRTPPGPPDAGRTGR